MQAWFGLRGPLPDALSTEGTGSGDLGRYDRCQGERPCQVCPACMHTNVMHPCNDGML